MNVIVLRANKYVWSISIKGLLRYFEAELLIIGLYNISRLN